MVISEMLFMWLGLGRLFVGVEEAMYMIVICTALT